MQRPHDVIVIGAGMAGLAAAHELSRNKLRSLVLEARDRIGGRVATVRSKVWPIPAELGAEFIHGGNGILWKIVREADLAPCVVADRHWVCSRGQLRLEDDYWQRLDRVTQSVAVEAVRHSSIQEFLTERKRSITPDDAAMARQYVEGFYAAPTERMSASALFSPGSEPQFRMPEGYDRMTEAIQGGLGQGTEIRLRSIVTDVRWRTGHVEITSKDESAGKIISDTARAAIITLPLGVLQAKPPALGAVSFDPPIEELRQTIEALGMGHAIRVSFLFASDFWSLPIIPQELREGQGNNLGFIHTTDPGSPVWWGRAPVPVVIGWLGGPAAQAAAATSATQIVNRMLKALAGIFGCRAEQLEEKLLDFKMHNWSEDPFSRGAYSYPTAGAEDGPMRLRRSIAGTLYFAGEATAAAAEIGTVHGALSSGVRAARAIAAVLALPP